MNSSSDSGSDTFDIFSSRESLKNDDYNNNNASNASPKRGKLKMDLSIDLSGLNSDDDDVKKEKVATKEQPATINNVENPKENDDDNFILSVNASKRNSSSATIRQVKPDNIPNLALDQFDDDRSQSVTVSLAKSMCKEIDYKKEMEAIISKESFNHHESDNLNQPKSNRLKPIDLESLKVAAAAKKAKRIKPPHAPSNFNLTSSIKQVLMSHKK